MIHKPPALIEKPTQIIFEPFPKQQEFVDAALSGLYDFILYGGAIRGGKTIGIIGLFLLMAKVFPGSRWFIVRKDLPVIKKNLYPTWEKMKPTNFIRSQNLGNHTHTFKNGSQLIFFAEQYKTDKDLERWRGLEANGFGFEEINECQEKTLGKAHERVGTYIVPELEIQPPSLVVASCNPTQGWVKELIYNPWKKGILPKNLLYIQSKITDNLPFLKANPGYLERAKRVMSPFEYAVFIDGDWDIQLKTGGEWLREFEIKKHVFPDLSYDPDHLIQLSMDSNTYPYISFTLWQFVPWEYAPGKMGTIIRLIDELCPEDPNNTADRAGTMIAEHLRDVYDYKYKVPIYGDKSTKNRNTIDPYHRSFFQIVEQKIKEYKLVTWDRMWKSPPPVHSMGDFVNAILGGRIPHLKIEISESCKKSIGDFIATKTGNDGELLKVREPHPKIEDLTYEKNGHLTDTLKDIICQAFKDDYTNYLNRFKKLAPGGIVTIQRGNNITL